MSNHSLAIDNRALAAVAGASMALTASVALFHAYPAVAAEEARLGIEEIIVTARKREESLQTVPLAVTAIRAEDLEVRSVRNIADVLRLAPNVTFASGGAAGGSAAQVYIRGVGQGDFAITSDPGVGIYVDGVYLGRSTGSLLDVLDLERVEVLRGPQGTLFGRNTVGGAVSFTSQKPTGELGGYVQATVGRYNRIDGRASLDFPIIADRLAAKVSVASLNRDGYQRRSIDDLDLGDQDALVGRAVFLLNASENIDFTLTVDGTRRREESVPQSLVGIANTALLGLYNATVGASLGTPLTAAYITNDRYLTHATGPSVSNVDNWGVSGVIDVDLSPVRIKSITSYRDLELLFARETDGSPLPYLEVINDDEQTQFSQELQLTTPLFNDRADLLVGLYYFRERASDNSIAWIASGLSDFIPMDLSRLDSNNVKTNSYAAFSELNVNVIDKLRFTIGARYTHEKKSYDVVAVRANLGTTFVGPLSLSDDWSSFTPKVSLDFQATDSVMLYASFSKGFRSGGFNSRANSDADVTSYDPEKLDNFEIGLKSDLLDRRLRFNATAFYSNYKDMQVNVIRPVGLSFINTIDNAAKSRIKGVELEAVAEPAEGLVFNGAVGYADAEYRKLDPGVTFTIDSKLIETPKWTANVGMQYGFAVGNLGQLTLRGDYFYRSRVYHDVFNSELIAQPGYSLINARATLLTANDAVEIAVFGTNLTNKTYNLFGVNALTSLGIASVQYARPREWGVEAKYRF
ncbi:MAG: TonB-dependent receptor [Sphingomonadales bacterium]|nr:TonB-dependent receptor [Sphingomonadales bacterium]